METRMLPGLIFVAFSMAAMLTMVISAGMR
jgi:hypothetical protein